MLRPFRCVATATDECQSLATLIRCDGETSGHLLRRVENAIDKAFEEEIFIDEINNGPDNRI